MKEILSKLVNVYKKYGFRGFCRKLWGRFRVDAIDRLGLSVRLRPERCRSELRRLLAGDFDRVILWRSSFGFQVPLYQRPQHISRALAKNRCLVFYEVNSMTDGVRELREREANLVLFNFTNAPLRRMLAEELAACPKPKYVEFYSTNWEMPLQRLKEYEAAGYSLIYEYVDHISADIAGTSTLPRSIAEKYDYAMTHPEVFVVVTAELLRQDVLRRRGEGRLCFSSNGVDYGFFQRFEAGAEPDEAFRAVQRKGKPIVCYYGALAKWFDYELVRKIADSGDYSVVLFGVRYDGSFDSELGGRENVFFLGPRDYSVLKYYARECDVLMIPFRINDVTRSTSPVKIFEYMALHKPIVVTDMDECRQYRSVLIGRDHEEFLAKLREAMALRGDADYIALLDREARENDWSQKAGAILDMLRENE
ncbi:MAG: glycosyltransferase [Oscillospiraceae bacterium]|nr:glycosyltransferase [Oscillospiraceae bacterium]